MYFYKQQTERWGPQAENNAAAFGLLLSVWNNSNANHTAVAA